MRRSETPPTIDVLCIGYACVDFVLPFVGLPHYDRKHEIPNLLLEGGGPASTAAVALRRLGRCVRLITVLGDDEWGTFASRRLQEEGVDVTALLRRENARTPVSIILADPVGGGRTIVWNRGTTSAPSSAELADRLRPARLFLIDPIHLTSALTAWQYARERGIPVLLDAGTPAPGIEPLVFGVDYLVTSEHFPTRFTGLDEPEDAINALYEKTGKPVVTTRGDRGCWVRDERGLWEIGAYPIEPIDTTAAGDAFHAAFAFGLLCGWEIHRICTFANYYASRNCTALGGRAGLPDLDAVSGWMPDGAPPSDLEQRPIRIE